MLSFFILINMNMEDTTASERKDVDNTCTWKGLCKSLSVKNSL